VGRGDRVGIWSPKRGQWLLTQFATARMGAGQRRTGGATGWLTKSMSPRRRTRVLVTNPLLS